MRRAKRGFTLIEAVVTIAIMSVVFGLSALCFSNLFRIQDESSKNTQRQIEANRINNLVSDFVSFLSVKTDELSFSFSSKTETSIIFVSSKSSTHTLSYSSSQLSVTYANAGEVEYLKYENSVSLSNDSTVIFDFESTLKILKMDCSISGKEFSYAYVLKV